ncbi:hypothetical protein [Enterobacter cloacae]|uniref:hypothetical protein n=1 Tax=Enterobacter cloacae TaxID=550 RepID=UPI00338F5BED
MLPISSYHDVHVEIDGEKKRFSDLPFNMVLHLTRSTGWELWRMKDDGVTGEVVSGEFHAKDEVSESIPFRLWFGNELVFDNTMRK